MKTNPTRNFCMIACLLTIVVLPCGLPATAAGSMNGNAGTTADQPGPRFQAFIDRVTSALPADRTAIVDSFMAATPSFPWIEDSVAQFIYRGGVSSVTVPGDANGWNPNGSPMSRLSSTDLWYWVQVFERDARLDYKFVTNGSAWILDPRNPHTVSGGFGPNSELAMPEYIQPWEIQYRASIPHGRVESRNIYSVNRGVTYSLYVYLPPGYDGSGISYPTAYFHDGSDYLNLGSAVNVIDNLIDSNRIAPVIAVFVTPTNRNEEYAFSARNQYRLFFANELVPYVDGLYRTERSPEKRATIGDSFGGNISALISHYHPNVFGLCGLHSGAFWPNNYEAYNLIVNGPVKSDSIRYCSVWGTYESLYPNMRAFRDSLLGKGYGFSWMERHEGHSWGLWRATTDIVLEDFFPGSALSVPEKGVLPAAYEVMQNYPNPFNPATTIRFTIGGVAGLSGAFSSGVEGPAVDKVRLVAYDILGREVAVLLNERKAPGSYSVRFDASGLASGVYLYRLTAGGYAETRKMLLLR